MKITVDKKVKKFYLALSKFFESVGKDLIKIINKHSTAVFDKCLMEQRKHMFSRLGEMPPVEVYDMEEDA